MLHVRARYAQELPVKTLIASFILVGSVAAGMLVLAGHFLAAPMRETRLAATPAATMMAALMPPDVAELPTRDATSHPTPSPSPAPVQAASFPARGFAKAPPTHATTRIAAPALPTETPTSPSPSPSIPPSRSGCDPAYPDEDTCIPPGPPFDQGCAITEERRFTVLPPDPQRLDHDEDGIGCEPIA